MRNHPWKHSQKGEGQKPRLPFFPFLRSDPKKKGTKSPPLNPLILNSQTQISCCARPNDYSTKTSKRAAY